MKRIILIIVTSVLVVWGVSAQKLVIGEKAPEMHVGSWLLSAPQTDGVATMVEFFHSSNAKSVERLATLDALARERAGKIVVIVVARENSPAVSAMLTADSPAYFPALDDGGKTFSAFSAQYVPYAVLYDRRGRVLWVGNPTSVSNDDILGMI